MSAPIKYLKISRKGKEYERITSYPTKGGHGQSGQFYATLDTIIVPQSGPKTHIALQINPVIHFFHHLSK